MSEIKYPQCQFLKCFTATQTSSCSYQESQSKAHILLWELIAMALAKQLTLIIKCTISNDAFGLALSVKM